jgi:AraC-like DNA-binding protein
MQRDERAGNSMPSTDRLQNTNDAVSEIALSLGYDSESAFSMAFKRIMGCSSRADSES